MHLDRKAGRVLSVALWAVSLGGVAGCAMKPASEAAGRPRPEAAVHGWPETKVASPQTREVALAPPPTSPAAGAGLPDVPIRMPRVPGAEVQLEPYVVEKTKLSPYIIQNIIWTRTATIVPPGANATAGSFTMMLVADKTAVTRAQGLVLWVEPGPQSMQVARIGGRAITDLRSDEALYLLRESGEPVQVTVHVRGGGMRTIDCYLRPR